MPKTTKPASKQSYQARAKAHLADWKVARLGVTESGVWEKNGRQYRHILPRSLRRLNIIEPVRSEFFTHPRTRRIKLHSDFHHLTSSQALCFNLFFPFLATPGVDAHPLLKVLGVSWRRVVDWWFEHVPAIPKGEGTNFDLFAESDTGERLYVEVKFTENAFGGTDADDKHRAKLDSIYRRALAGKVRETALDEAYFFKHYQLLRNVSYADPGARARVVFLVPRANESLLKALADFDLCLLDSVRSVVAVVFLEDLLDGLASSAPDPGPLGSVCISLLKEKYVVPSTR